MSLLGHLAGPSSVVLPDPLTFGPARAEEPSVVEAMSCESALVGEAHIKPPAILGAWPIGRFNFSGG